METHVFLAVLAAALCHASWNALLKRKLEPLKAVTIISVGCGIVTLPAVFVVDVPVQDSWIFIAASLAIHMFYYLALGEAYRLGDLGQIYPIARGTAPLITAVGASFLLGEHLGFAGGLAIGLLTSGIVLLSWKGGRPSEAFNARAIAFALLTAMAISAYTIVDATGGRIGTSALPYLVWLIFLDGVMMLLFGLWRWPRDILRECAQAPSVLLLGGLFSTVSYGIAVWAMSVAPVAMVAALRETSVLFAAIIGIVVLREPVMPIRIVAGMVVMAGIIMLRLR